jgi:hypothetical protein
MIQPKAEKQTFLAGKKQRQNIWCQNLLWKKISVFCLPSLEKNIKYFGVKKMGYSYIKVGKRQRKNTYEDLAGPLVFEARLDIGISSPGNNVEFVINHATGDPTQ